MGVTETFCILLAIFRSTVCMQNVRLFSVYDVGWPFLADIHSDRCSVSCLLMNRWVKLLHNTPTSASITHLQVWRLWYKAQYFYCNSTHWSAFPIGFRHVYSCIYINSIIHFLAATKQLYEWYFLSVRPSVCPSHLFDYVLIIISSFSGVITTDQGNVHAKGQGQRSKVKVTEVTTQLSRFRTVTPVWIHIWWWNDIYSLILLRTLLFFKVIGQSSRSYGGKNRRIWPRMGVSGLWLQFKFTIGNEMLHKAWIRTEEVPYCFSKSSVKFQGHMALKIVDFDPDWAFLDCNSSLNSSMATKCCTKLEEA